MAFTKMAEEDGQILIKNHQKKTKTEENGDWSSRFPCIGDNLCDGGYIDIVESRVKKRKRRKKLDKNEEDKFTVEKGHDLPIESVKKQDPLVVLGYDITHMIFGYLDARSVCKELWHGWQTSAPEYWRDLDPYWKGTGKSMRHYFHQDGSQTADPGDEVWGGHEACYSIVTGLQANGNVREHYVRVNHWPQMYIARKQDWSWEMSNSLCRYSSMPDPDKEDGTGPYYIVI